MCPYTSPSDRSLDLELFQRLHFDGRNLIHQWHRHAEAQRSGGNVFEGFIFLWIAFNGFGSCVTQEEKDWKIIKKIRNCPDLRRRFADLRATDNEFAGKLDDFSKYWPIFKVQDLRRLKLLYYDPPSREEQIARYLAADEQPEHEPSCFQWHRDRGERVPMDLPHTMATIYRVRCNLFHGEKALETEMDRRIVAGALEVLALFIKRARLFD